MLIAAENLTHVYAPGTPMEVTSVKGISMTVNEGDFLAVVGATGSGKSTLVQHFNGLLLPTAGRVLVEGTDTRDRKHRGTLWRKVGLVFQYPEQQLFEETVFDDVAYGPRNMDLTQRQVEKRVREALDLVGLEFEEVARLSPFALSGGQKRRVAIAGILAVKPKMLILDEPTAGLDPAGHFLLMEKIKSLQTQQGITVILVTHNMEDVARLAQRVMVLSRGEAVLEGTPGQIFADPGRLRGLGLDLPFPAELTHRLREAGRIKGPLALTMEEAEAGIKNILKRGE